MLDGKIADQGQTSSCVGHGVARAIQLRLRAGVDTQAERPSALGVYLQARQGAGSARDGYPDDGATIADACESVGFHGYCRDSVWPFDAGEVTSALPWDVAQAEFDQIGLKHHRLFGIGEDRCRMIRSALSAGCGVAIGIDVDAAFMDLHGSAAWPGLTSPSDGGHCMAALDWDLEALRVVNSWSKNWGDYGLGRITWGAIATQARSVWIIDAAVCYSS